MKRKSQDMALCGSMCALAVAIMAMGTLIPAATYCCPVLASMTLLPVLILCGEKLSWVLYAASAILSLLLTPDKEAAAIFLALGYYPIVKPKLDRKRKPARLACKLLLFNLSVLAVYAALLFVLQMDALRQEFSAMSTALLVLLLAGGNGLFLLDDALLGRLTPRVKTLCERYKR